MLKDTIVALSTAAGAGAVAMIRVSGEKAILKVDEIFKSHSGVPLQNQNTHTLHLGYICDGDRIIDESLVSVFQGKRSYTGEPTAEISCHGSPYIQQEIINLLLRRGVRMAHPGEFTLRAFVNGKMDLSQAEAVADLIASDNAASHQLAMQQMRGGFSNEIQYLRQELLNFASLIELELDFSEEDVEFADRTHFQQLVKKILKTLNHLIDSFSIGNVLKNGISVAIVGEPNAGKSTLLNALLNEERAIVSDIEGTTRDTIEDTLSIDGVGFRFIDTAGIRKTTDVIEQMGIRKTFEKMQQSQVILYLFDAEKVKQTDSLTHIQQEIQQLKEQFSSCPFVVVANKKDALLQEDINLYRNSIVDVVFISAKQKEGISILKKTLIGFVQTGALRNQQTIVTNARHYEALLNAQQAMLEVQKGLDEGISADLLAIDIRQGLHYFGEITGEITTDELLGNIFANFCIGK